MEKYFETAKYFETVDYLNYFLRRILIERRFRYTNTVLRSESDRYLARYSPRKNFPGAPPPDPPTLGDWPAGLAAAAATAAATAQAETVD